MAKKKNVNKIIKVEDTDYFRYAENCLNGSNLCCESVYNACKRFLNDLDNPNFEFRTDKVEECFRFFSCLKHFKGASAGNPFLLEPWQKFILANLLGFYRKDTGTRRFRQSYIEVPRKNGKTALISALAMRMLLDEKGAEIILASPSYKQSTIAFEFCQKFSKNLDPKGKSFKTYRDNIKLPETDSKLFCVASDANRLDGFNPSFAIIDEFHQSPDSKVLNALIQGMNNRPSAMACIITTAGVDNTSPCYLMHQECIEILKGLKQNDSFFSIIYSLDKNDDWENSDCWKKAVPNLGITVYEHALKDLVERSKGNPTEEAHTKTKNFNLWQSVSEEWIPESYILDCSVDMDFKDFAGCETYMGIDLSSTSDLTAVSYLMLKCEELYLKTEYYLPAETVRTSPNKEKYSAWVKEGYLKMTQGNVVDYDIILKDILDRMKLLRIQKIAYDQYNATQFAINATSQGLPLQPFSQSLFNFNKPTKEINRKILSNTIKLDNNPINRWCFNNAVLKYDYNGNCKPIKGNNSSTSFKSNKIDGVIAMIQALGVFMETPRFTGSIFTL